MAIISFAHSGQSHNACRIYQHYKYINKSSYRIIFALNKFYTHFKMSFERITWDLRRWNPFEGWSAPLRPSRLVEGSLGFVFLFFWSWQTPAGIIRHVINKIAILTRHAYKGSLPRLAHVKCTYNSCLEIQFLFLMS